MFSGNGIEDTLASASCFGFWIWGFLKHTHPVWLYTSPQTKGRFVFPTLTLQSDVVPQYEGLWEKGEMEDKPRPPSFHNFPTTAETDQPTSHSGLRHTGNYLAQSFHLIYEEIKSPRIKSLTPARQLSQNGLNPTGFFPFRLRCLNLKWKWNCNFY